ncbi:transcriptional regulator, MerR family [Pseudonocardia thermophila]|uniref:Transcriptional regulator, MerR family n=1 Tax=Pseudonocardia thermophila TaxID=1848 RepID=A0A1M6PE55_PSETH|nr:MerR family transcriptional regulator [Pseudonocardia thermophila]SHK06170.1 transcriptional regulator, MerR family [Pseudonocardia thermophila]
MTATADLATPLLDQAMARLRAQETGAPPPDATLTIAEMAERTGVSAHTLRYYERIGLLEVARDASGHRVYTATDFARVLFLTRMRMTGMPIRDLKRYVALAAAGEETIPERRAMLLARRDAVKAQLTELQFALDTIEAKLTGYGCVPGPEFKPAPLRRAEPAPAGR